MGKMLLTFAALPLLALAQAPVPAPPQLPVSAPVINDPDLFTSAYQVLMPSWIGQVAPYATEIFYALAGLELAIFGCLLWWESRGDITAAMGLVTRKVLALGLFLTLLQNMGSWMGLIISAFTSIGQGVTGMPGLSPTTIMARGNAISNTLTSAGAAMGSLSNPVAGLPLIFCGFVILFGFFVIMVQVVVLKVATFVALGGGFIVLAFGGLKATANYVERYFSLCITIGLRLFFLYLMVSGGMVLTNVWITQAANAPKYANSAQLAMTIMCSCLLYSVLCWFVPSFCSSALSGRVSLSHGEVAAAFAPAISAAVSSGMALGSVAARAASGGGTEAGSSSGATQQAAGGSPSGRPAGSAPPQPVPDAAAAVAAGTSEPGGFRKAAFAVSGAVGKAAIGAAQIAAIAANAASRVPHGENAASTRIDGFNH